MTAPWVDNRCPRCGRHSEQPTLAPPEKLPHNLGTKYKVEHEHGTGEQRHTWLVRWVEEGKTA